MNNFQPEKIILSGPLSIPPKQGNQKSLSWVWTTISCRWILSMFLKNESETSRQFPCKHAQQKDLINNIIAVPQFWRICTERFLCVSYIHLKNRDETHDACTNLDLIKKNTSILHNWDNSPKQRKGLTQRAVLHFPLACDPGVDPTLHHDPIFK